MSDDLRVFVVQSYRDILNREPDISGLEFFIKKISDKEISKEQLQLILRESKEYKQTIKYKEQIHQKHEKIHKYLEREKKKNSKIRYGDISVNYKSYLDGGGRYYGKEFISVVKDTLGKVPRICEFGAGSGFIGFSLLAHGLCESLCLIDINPESIPPLI